MADHNIGLYHYHIRKRIHQKYEEFPHPDKLKRTMDKIIYVVVILGPLMNIPQLFKIWYYKDASGVSVVSWFGFSIFSAVWLFYGILHKEKPIIFMNIGLIIVQILIAVGALIYGNSVL